MSDEMIKTCPNCGGDEFVEVYQITQTAVRCLSCRFKVSLYFWDALPRREEFYEELMKISEVLDDGDRNGARFMLKTLADKLQPAKPEEGNE